MHPQRSGAGSPLLDQGDQGDRVDQGDQGDGVAPGAEHTAAEIAQQPRLWREVAATAVRDRARTEAFLAPLHAAGLPERETGLAFSLLYDYTLGFALSSPTSTNEQRVQDAATRSRLHAFLRSLPADRFPTLVALAEHVWLDNRDERFTAGLVTLLDGLQAERRRRQRSQQTKR